VEPKNKANKVPSKFFIAIDGRPFTGEVCDYDRGMDYGTMTCGECDNSIFTEATLRSISQDRIGGIYFNPLYRIDYDLSTLLLEQFDLKYCEACGEWNFSDEEMSEIYEEHNLGITDIVELRLLNGNKEKAVIDFPEEFAFALGLLFLEEGLGFVDVIHGLISGDEECVKRLYGGAFTEEEVTFLYRNLDKHFKLSWVL
jgi:hypothetical protein